MVLFFFLPMTLIIATNQTFMSFLETIFPEVDNSKQDIEHPHSIKKFFGEL